MGDSFQLLFSHIKDLKCMFMYGVDAWTLMVVRGVKELAEIQGIEQ